MNYSLFNDHMKLINNILKNNKLLDPREIEYKKQLINKEFISMIKNQNVTNRFYELSHEIRCIDFLNKYGKLYISKDSLHEAGCDFKLDNNVQIEAVCSSRGQENLNGMDKIPEFGIINYNILENIILSRITNSISEKVEFYITHVNKSINPDRPYVIFLGLGNLTYRMLTSRYGFELNKILLGVSYPYLTFDRKKNTFSEFNYSYNSELKISKYNEKGIKRNVDIPANFFCNPKNNFVSAIIYSNSSLETSYNTNNTFIFLNPYAKNKLKISNFKNVFYWKSDKDNNYNLRKNGKKYNFNKHQKFF